MPTHTPTPLPLQQEYPAYALVFKYMMHKHIVEFGSLSLGAAAQQGVLKAPANFSSSSNCSLRLAHLGHMLYCRLVVKTGYGAGLCNVASHSRHSTCSGETARPGAINANMSATTAAAPAPAPAPAAPAVGGVRDITPAEFDRIVEKTNMGIDQLGGAIDIQVRQAIVDACKGMGQWLRAQPVGQCSRGMHVLKVLCLFRTPCSQVSSAVYLQGRR
jgi:hypothetical protein